MTDPTFPWSVSWVCPSCQSPLSSPDALCSKCGLAPVGLPSNDRTQFVDVCRIQRWRGYFKSTFYAVTQSGQVVGESRRFRWRGPDTPPDAGRARIAYDELLRSLLADGWRRFDLPSRDWFDTHLARPRVVPPDFTAGSVLGPIEALAPPQELHPVEPVGASPPPQPITFAPIAHVSVSPPLGDDDSDAPGEEPEPGSAPAVEATRRFGKRWLMGLVGLVVVVAAAAVAVFELGWIHVRTAATSPTAAASAVAVRQASAAVGQSGPAGQANTPAAGAKKTSRSHPAKRKKQAGATPASRSSATPSGAAPLTDLRISAHGNGSWIEIRRNSSSGKVLYSGQLNAGRRLHFRGERLWVRFGGASNLSITVDGKIVELSGTLEKVFASAANS